MDLADEWELRIVQLFRLSVYSNGFGADVNYDVVKDYCDEVEFERIETFGILKRVCAEVYARD